MADYIERETVLNALSVFNDRIHGNEHFLNGIETAKEIVDKTPSADVVPMEWIPVTERLPEQNGKYLAFALKEENTMDFYDEHWMLCGTDYRHYVTHWMPLPKPPVLN